MRNSKRKRSNTSENLAAQQQQQATTNVEQQQQPQQQATVQRRYSIATHHQPKTTTTTTTTNDPSWKSYFGMVFTPATVTINSANQQAPLFSHVAALAPTQQQQHQQVYYCEPQQTTTTTFKPTMTQNYSLGNLYNGYSTFAVPSTLRIVEEDETTSSNTTRRPTRAAARKAAAAASTEQTNAPATASSSLVRRCTIATASPARTGSNSLLAPVASIQQQPIQLVANAGANYSYANNLTNNKAQQPNLYNNYQYYNNGTATQQQQTSLGTFLVPTIPATYSNVVSNATINNNSNFSRSVSTATLAPPPLPQRQTTLAPPPAPNSSTKKQRTRTTGVEQQQEAAPAVPKRRGRPPKNVSASTSSLSFVEKGILTTADNKEQQKTSSSAVTAAKTLNKCVSNSHLQRNKVTEEKFQFDDVDDEIENRENNYVYSKQQPPPTQSTPVSAHVLQPMHEYYFQRLSKQKPTNVTTAYNPLPELNWTDSRELWLLMRKKEQRHIHDPTYLQRHRDVKPPITSTFKSGTGTSMLCITADMRMILLDWLVEVSNAYRLHRESWHMAVEFFDRFMSRCTQQMRADRLQLAGITSLFLAAKCEEIYPPKLKEMAGHLENYSSDNEQAIASFELFMLKTLGWDISPVTCNTWITLYLQVAAVLLNSNNNNNKSAADSTTMVWPMNVLRGHIERTNETRAAMVNASRGRLSLSPLGSAPTRYQEDFYLTNYVKCVTLIDMCLFEFDAMRFNYSMLAASAMYLMVNIVPNSNAMMSSVAALVQRCTGYTLNELDACIKWMCPYAEVCREMMLKECGVNNELVKRYPNIDAEDMHNIQMYFYYIDPVKAARERKKAAAAATPPCKYNQPMNTMLPNATSMSNLNISTSSTATNLTINSQLLSHQQQQNGALLTPPDSQRKYSLSSCSSNSSSSSSSSANSSQCSSSSSTPNNLSILLNSTAITSQTSKQQQHQQPHNNCFSDLNSSLNASYASATSAGLKKAVAGYYNY